MHNDYNFPAKNFSIIIYYGINFALSKFANCLLCLWARMDSNHRTPKRTDLQSVAVGHLATCPTHRVKERDIKLYILIAIVMLPLTGSHAIQTPEPEKGLEPPTS